MASQERRQEREAQLGAFVLRELVVEVGLGDVEAALQRYAARRRDAGEADVAGVGAVDFIEVDALDRGFQGVGEGRGAHVKIVEALVVREGNAHGGEAPV